MIHVIIVLTVLSALVACESKENEDWRLVRPTAWYLMTVHDYAVYTGQRQRIADDAERTVLGVFDSESQCTEFYMTKVPRTPNDYDRFWSCFPNTDPVLKRLRINWAGFPVPASVKQ